MSKKTIVFDFDGVIHSYTSGWQGMSVIADPPTPGIKELIQKLRNSGYEVVVVSTRCKSPVGFLAIRQWLNDNNIEVDNITPSKPPALVYVDDRAYRFKGPMNDISSINKTYEEITSAVPWMKEDE